MKQPATYSSAKAFRQALEMRLSQLARLERGDVQKLRRQVAFDRLLARLFALGESRWILKGGYAMELWLQKARATRDIDLTLRSLSAPLAVGELLAEVLRGELESIVSRSLSDWFEFRVGAAMLELDAAPYGGARFPIDARLDGRVFVRFHVDIGIGDAVLEPVEKSLGRDWLAFAGVEPPTIRLLSREQQFAEKLHAYTLPNRPSQNSRVKDLVDLALLVTRLALNQNTLCTALQDTFARRKTHPLPPDLFEPPTTWETPFSALASETTLGLSMAEAFETVRAFYLRTGVTDAEVTPS